MGITKTGGSFRLFLFILLQFIVIFVTLVIRKQTVSVML